MISPRIPSDSDSSSNLSIWIALLQLLAERQVAAGFWAMAGVVLVSQWNAIKLEIFGGGDSSAVVQAVNEDTRHIWILIDHVQWVERRPKR